MTWRYCYTDVLPFAAMVMVECTTVGLNTLFKAASLKGMKFSVFLFYSYAFATVLLLPFSFVFPSSRRFPSVKSPLVFRIFLFGLLGFMAQFSGYKGIEYSSPTLASAIGNLTPAFTFTFAVIFRIERVILRSSITQAKIIGTMVSISGALLVVLYKGPKVFMAASSTLSTPHLPGSNSSDSSWIIGGLLIFSQLILNSLWYIVQTQIMEIYPAEVAVTFFYHLTFTLVSAPVCLLAERDLASWQLQPNLTLAAIMYSAILGSSLATAIHTWGTHIKGPVYVSMYKPMSIVIAVAMGAAFLHDSLYLGSVIGSIIMSVGFYTVIWAKAKEDATKTSSDMPAQDRWSHIRYSRP